MRISVICPRAALMVVLGLALGACDPYAGYVQQPALQRSVTFDVWTPAELERLLEGFARTEGFTLRVGVHDRDRPGLSVQLLRADTLILAANPDSRTGFEFALYPARTAPPSAAVQRRLLDALAGLAH